MLLKAHADGEAAFAGWNEECVFVAFLFALLLCLVLYLKFNLCVTVTVTGVGRRDAKE